MHKVILDTDPGVDDTMAIAYALAHPDIQLLGLTTVFGNINIDYATRNAQFVLDELGAADVAVAKGAAIPLVQSPLPHADFVHGADGLGNQYPGSTDTVPSREPVILQPDSQHASLDGRDAADFIIDTVKSMPGEVTLVAVGPLTNIAEALRRDSTLADDAAGLIVMGGCVDEPGNVSPVAEANFLNDPHAADEVFAAGWPATIVGLDVTHRIMLSDSHLKSLDEQADRTGSLIWRTSRFYVNFYATAGAAKSAVDAGEEPQCAMHDAAAIAYLLMPDAFQVEQGAVRVVPEGIAVGQLTLDRKGYDYALPHWRNRPLTGVCLSVDADRVRNDFLQTVINHHIR